MFKNCLRERGHCEIFLSADDAKYFLAAKHLAPRNTLDPSTKPCEQTGNCLLSIKAHLVLLHFTFVGFTSLGISLQDEGKTFHQQKKIMTRFIASGLERNPQYHQGMPVVSKS